jgi:hypothetical protein
LNPHCVHRQTACMRYMSAPHRSHRTLSTFDALRSTLSVVEGVVFNGDIGRTGAGGEGGSAIRRIIA